MPQTASPQRSDTSPVTLLGGNDARAADAAPKASMLHRAALAGVPIPFAVVVLDADHDAWIAEGCHLPIELRSTLVAVRSAFSNEDNARASQAGTYVSVLRIPGNDPPAIAAEIAKDLVTFCGQPDAGDLLLLGWSPWETPKSFAPERGARDETGHGHQIERLPVGLARPGRRRRVLQNAIPH